MYGGVDHKSLFVLTGFQGRRMVKEIVFLYRYVWKGRHEEGKPYLFIICSKLFIKSFFFKSSWLRTIYDTVVLCTGNTSFYCTSPIFFFFFFTNWRFVATPTLSKYMRTIFPTPFTHFVSVSLFDNSYNISNIFFVIIFVILVCDQWSLMLL